MNNRMGVMGGMFDPVHNGHLAAAMVARRTLDLDCLRLVPCFHPGHRQPATCNPAQRLHMLRLAIQGQDGLVADDREIRRQGVSYMVDTVTELQQEFPDTVLILVLGLDSLATLPTWHRWQDLMERCHLFVLQRPGFNLPLSVAAQLQLESRQVDAPEHLLHGTGGKIMLCSQLAVDLSSSEVRRRIRASESLAGLVPTAVQSYMQDQGLYRSQT